MKVSYWSIYAVSLVKTLLLPRDKSWSRFGIVRVVCLLMRMAPAISPGVLVVLMSSASLLSHTVIFSLCLVYYIAVFGDLCHHMNLPLLSVCRNVYFDGVYDLCHIGHKNLFKRALTNGNLLFVGEFLDKHQIHVVACGQEYFDKYPNTDDDPYYGYVRKIGIAKPMQRTAGMSTSDLIRRIQSAAPADERNDTKKSK
ncbi:hypothetical protein TrCOL_g4457 [Triparma columacea]|uniref:Uncharacterized protein n=1 Tax=Triparma columacea TaxID=722753 RepID=A0A9W7FWD5_9STRA|nr:hypothetical protein TrCOL_g4457 [Triparma columacea]